MTKRKKTIRKAPAASDAPSISIDDQVTASNLSLHELFQQQTIQMLDRADVSEEQRQSILVAMNCPCCGAGGMSFTAKLKR